MESKYPALLFKQQLDACVQKIFPMLRDNVKKDLTPLLTACIHAPRQGGARAARRTTSGMDSQGSGDRTPTTPQARGASAGMDSGMGQHWASIMSTLDQLLETVKANYVPPFLVRKLFEQLFAFINVQLFNQLLLRRECCSFSNGEYVKTGLAEVELWIGNAGRDWVGESWEQLSHIRQAVTFLVIHQKNRKSLQEITSDLCPVLSVQQLYRISTMYWDDRWGWGRGDAGDGLAAEGAWEGELRALLGSWGTLRRIILRAGVAEVAVPVQVWHGDGEPRGPDADEAADGGQHGQRQPLLPAG